MKKFLLFLSVAIPSLLSAGGPTITIGIFPQYVQGSATASNNNRVPYWCWVQVDGLLANATYHYFPAVDTLNASSTSNGAGNPYFVNSTTGVIRRSTNPSMTANTGYDSLTTNSSGSYSGWFGFEPTANGRFAPGSTVYFKLMLNNGAGGTTVLYRVLASTFPITAIGFGSTSMSATQGSALYDSLNATPKNFICVYDNVGATGRPLSAASVENDGMMLRPVSQIAAFYRNNVDSLANHWGTIIPNNLPNGVRALVEHDMATGASIDTTMDSDGIWCSGTNTVNMTNGSIPMYLNSTFVLTDNAMIADTTWTGQSTFYSASSNSPNATYTWDFGDGNFGSGSTTSHTYLAPGVVNVQVIISTGGCSDTINHTVVVLLGTGVFTPLPLSFQTAPNPTSGELFVTTKDKNEKLVNVFDVLGQNVYSREMSGNTLSIDITGNQPGIYFVQVKDKVTGKTGTKKIVLQ